MQKSRKEEPKTATRRKMFTSTEQFIVILQMECAALVQMHFLRQNGSEWDYSMPNINITSIWTLSSTGCIPAVFLTDVPSVSCPITQQHGALQSLCLSVTFHHHLGKSCLRCTSFVTLDGERQPLKRCCICFTCVCLLVRMGASWNWFCEVCGTVYLPCVSICHTLWHWDLS